MIAPAFLRAELREPSAQMEALGNGPIPRPGGRYGLPFRLTTEEVVA